MCRMLGIKNFEYQKHKDIIQKFFLLAEKGKVPPNNKKGHLDGWGVGWYENCKPKIYKSENSMTQEKEKFFNLIEKINKTKILIIHLRKSAWKNTNLAKHSHPFKDDTTKIIFAHNGTIYEYKNLWKFIVEKKAYWLDSETYFWCFINNFKKTKNIKLAFLKTIKEIKSTCKFSSLTCIFSEGKNLYCFREYKKLSNYYTLYLTEKNNTKIISSEKIIETLNWRLINKTKLVII